MFDDRSFSRSSFDDRSWFFDLVAAVTRWIKSLFVTKAEREVTVVQKSNEIFITKAR